MSRRSARDQKIADLYGFDPETPPAQPTYRIVDSGRMIDAMHRCGRPPTITGTDERPIMVQLDEKGNWQLGLVRPGKDYLHIELPGEWLAMMQQAAERGLWCAAPPEASA